MAYSLHYIDEHGSQHSVTIMIKNWYFLPHDAMRKRGLCCRTVSVRLSVTLMHCIHMAEDRPYRQTSSRSGSPIILVFWPPAPIPNSKGTPHSGGPKYTEGGKNLLFSNHIAIWVEIKWSFISETVRDRPMITMKR